MNAPIKQHLIDPEICIRCNTCEETCPVDAITHDSNNYVVDVAKCNLCLNCIPPCPTGSIDNWRVVNSPYTLEEQFSWSELPPQQEMPVADAVAIEALESEIDSLRMISRSHNTPFSGRKVMGRVLRTVIDGETRYEYSAAI